MEYTTYCLVFVGKTEVKHPKKKLSIDKAWI